MPHYADGTPAKLGDVVKGKTSANCEILGTVAIINAESGTCNMQVSELARIYSDETRRLVLPGNRTCFAYCTCKEFIKVAVMLIAVLVTCGVASAQHPVVGPFTHVVASEANLEVVPQKVAACNGPACSAHHMELQGEQFQFAKQRPRRLARGAAKAAVFVVHLPGKLVRLIRCRRCG